MPTDSEPETVIDAGLLNPVSVGHDRIVSDAEIVASMVTVEVALARTLGSIGVAPAEAVESIERASASLEIDAAELAAEAVSDGNPVIPLVKRMRAAVDAETGLWVHRGATSQDIVDSALAVVAHRATVQIVDDLDRVIASLGRLALQYRELPAVARTLTQHAVPTTLGARFADWLWQVADARDELARATLPAQLGGAAGTLAVLVESLGVERAAQVPAAFAASLGLTGYDAPWHTRRTAITRLGDAVTRVTDALGRIATDVATLTRTEIGELFEPSGGGSSAMPQKQNPVRSVLVRSASLRAPQLAATLHVSAATAVDERPDGAWHAEWPALRELLRLGLGAAAHAADLAEGLRVDEDAVARNLAMGGGAVMSERVMLVAAPYIGRARVQELIDLAGKGEDLAELLRAEPALIGVDVAALLDPVGYTGFATAVVDRAVARAEAIERSRA